MKSTFDIKYKYWILEFNDNYSYICIEILDSFEFGYEEDYYDGYHKSFSLGYISFGWRF